MFEDVLNKKFFRVIFLCFLCQFPANGFECGSSKHSEGFIIGGKFVSRGEYPWIAALVNFNTQKFFCGGTLITNSHVVTAAHCINPKSTQKTLLPKDIAVLLGKYNLNFTVERGSITLYLDQIHTHPDWRYHTEDYDADIAILKLQQSIIFSEYILPICWPSRKDVEPIFEGTVIGWGQSEDDTKKHEEIPKELQVQSITNEACFLDYHPFAIISSRRTFCAGVENAGPCFGDSGKQFRFRLLLNRNRLKVHESFEQSSPHGFRCISCCSATCGGGLFVKKNSNWIIRGIVSSSFVDKGKCDVTKYALYTNIIKYTDWTREILNQTTIIDRSELDEIIEPDDGEDDHHITIDCNYIDETNIHAIPVKQLYSCFVSKFDLPKRNSIAHINGKHRKGLSNQHVQAFHVKLHIELPYIPMGIGKIFPNLELFFIGQSSLKAIERKNFKGMSKVSSLFLGYNDLVDLPKNGFYELINLEALFIYNNKLKSLHRDLLLKMPKLKKLIAYNNQIEYLDSGIFRHNPQLKHITLRNNQLKTIGVNFKQLKDIEIVNLIQNLCIDSQFNVEVLIDDFQDLINKNCNI